MKNEKTVPVFFAADENYMPFLGVTLASMKKYLDAERKYAIHVLYTGELGKNARRVKEMETENFSVSFTDVSQKAEEIRGVMRCRDYYTSAIYFRLFIPDLFPEYEKAIYLDCDTVLLADVAKLYDEEIGDNYIGAVADEVVAGIPQFRVYVKNALGIEPENYFNSGVIVMNLKELRALDFYKTFYGVLSSYDFIVAPDQDCLNLICKDKVFYYGSEWNKMPTAGGEKTLPKLIHYNLCMKPWHYDGVLYEEYFWEIARQTPFYELILTKKLEFTPERAKCDEEGGKKLLALAQAEADSPNNYLRTVAVTK
ncbi:MAG: glycosyltransferase family 8 protein [Clostridia bacterium]|nr:glycosyltransferase family 8 protein [Clostridia bacterium]